MGVGGNGWESYVVLEIESESATCKTKDLTPVLFLFLIFNYYPFYSHNSSVWLHIKESIHMLSEWVTGFSEI